MPSSTLVGPHRHKVETMESTFWAKGRIPKHYTIDLLGRISLRNLWTGSFHRAGCRAPYTNYHSLAPPGPLLLSLSRICVVACCKFFALFPAITRPAR